MDWARILAFATRIVHQELLARNEYLAVENWILHRNRRVCDCGPDAVRRSERKTRACGDVERRGGREIRFHRKR